MMVWRTIESAIISLKSHAFRSLLAALGIVLGGAAVVGMLAIGAGARSESIDAIRSMGIDTIILHSQKPMASEDTNNSQSESGQLLEFGLKKKDRQHIESTFENIRDIVPVKMVNHPIYNKGGVTTIKLLGVTPGFMTVTNSASGDVRGRWLVDSDEDNLRSVCVLGKEAAAKLFRFKDPVGQAVTVGGFSFKVVGLLSNSHGRRLPGGQSLENRIYIPFATADTLFRESGASPYGGEVEVVEVDHLFIKVKRIEMIANTAARLRGYLEKTHTVKDYTMQVPQELLSQEEATQRIFTMVMASIAAISLLVGGIGIMNIMLANIYERTQEIGTLRALGAKRRDILIQFVVEAIVLTGSGGAFGVALGIGIAKSVEHFTSMRTEVTVMSTVPAFAVSLATGLIFGTYPAWKAARLNPVAALRRV